MMPPITANLLDTELSSQWQQQLHPMWQQFVHGDLHSSDQTRLSYSYYLVKPAKQAVVFSTGRVEMAVKYIELMQEFITAGYSVFILDHRGQGQSARLHPDPQLGYVVDFQDYVDDFKQFVSEVVQPFGHQQHLLLAHSMGAAIACRYLQQQPHLFNAAIFCSPMFGISAGALPATMAYKLISAYGWFRSQLSLSNQHYFPGQTPYLDKPFTNNLLTHSPHRYQWLRLLYQLYPESQLGGVSWPWLTQAIKAMAWLQQNAVAFNVPILLLQAAEDKVVSNNAQTRWFYQLPATLYKQQVFLAGAYHEIWMEKDAVRLQAITAVNRFLANLP